MSTKGEGVRVKRHQHLFESILNASNYYTRAPPYRSIFYRGTAPQRATGFDTVQQCFHLLNNFDIPIGIEHSQGDIPDIPSATQWTSAIDLTNRKVYYKTAYNNSIRCIDLKAIDFSMVKYQSQPLDKIQEQPVEMVKIPR